MTDQSTAPSMTRPRGPSRETVTRLENHLGDVLGTHTQKLNNQAEMTAVQDIAFALKALTYDQAQEIGAGLAATIEVNKDKEKSFDFSNLTVKLAPTLTHLVQTWASGVVESTRAEQDKA